MIAPPLISRARIVLLASQGLANAEIARQVGVSGPTVLNWRNRYRAGGLQALGDLPRSGWPATHDELAVLAATLAAPPQALGVTHWSSRSLGAELGISFATVARTGEVEPAAVGGSRRSSSPPTHRASGYPRVRLSQEVLSDDAIDELLARIGAHRGRRGPSDW